MPAASPTRNLAIATSALGDVAADAVHRERLGRPVRRGAGGGDLAGERRQVLLHRLELGDRPARVHAVERDICTDWSRMRSSAPAICWLRAAAAIRVEAGPGSRPGASPIAVEAISPPSRQFTVSQRLAAEPDAGGDRRQALGVDQRDDGLAALRRDDRDVLCVAGERHEPRAAAELVVGADP